jgi:hypothetical protein
MKPKSGKPLWGMAGAPFKKTHSHPVQEGPFSRKMMQWFFKSGGFIPMPEGFGAGLGTQPTRSRA